MVNFRSKDRYDANDLREIVEILRGEDGCPWDRVQTHKTIRRDLLEEAAELCEAIDRADPGMMLEELGDVWLQVIFHASLEQEAGHFTLDDVADAECRKLIGRHAHVFGDAKAADADQALQVWEEQKRTDKEKKNFFHQIFSVETLSFLAGRKRCLLVVCCFSGDGNIPPSETP